MNKNRVVITGLGFVTPCGIDKEEFWKNLCYGDSRVAKIFLCDTEGIGSQIAAQVEDFNGINWGLESKEIEGLDRFVQFGIKAAKDAIDDSRIDLRKEKKERIGVVTGSAVGSATNTEKEWKRVSENGQKPINAGLVGKYLYESATPHQLTLEILRKHDITGPSRTVSTGCTTGIDTIGIAFEMVKNNQIDVCICGTSEAPITRIAVDAFDRIGALSTRNEEPQKALKPYDKNRDGFVIGEGACFLVIESLPRALERNANIYCEIKSFASVCNAYHMTGSVVKHFGNH